MSSDYVAGAVGGVLIGVASAVLLLGAGKIMGISGILTPFSTAPLTQFSLSPPTESGHIPVSDSLWRLTFIAMVLACSSLAGVISPSLASRVASNGSPWPLSLLGGALVGAGTTLSNGCTSGHGVCGLGRLSYRSFAAVSTFFPVAIITASLTGGLQNDPAPTEGHLYVASPSTGLYLAALTIGAALSFFLVNRNHAPPAADVGRSLLPSLVSGALFAAGLMISGMSDPDVVRSFLDLNVSSFEQWNGTLAAVMAAACAVSLATYQYKKCHPMEQPLLCSTPEPCECSFNSIPNSGKPDRKLFFGSTLFGIGWGISGVCPGPALVGAALGANTTIYFYLPAFFLAKAFASHMIKSPLIPLIPVDVSGTVDERDRTDPNTARLDTCGNPIPRDLAEKAKSWLSLVPQDKYAPTDGSDPTDPVSLSPSIAKGGISFISVEADALSLSLADSLCRCLDDLPRPTLVSCMSGARATAVSRMYLARRRGVRAEEVLSTAEEKKEAWVRNAKLVTWMKECLSDGDTTGFSKPLIFRQLFDKESSTYTYLLGDSDTRQAILIDPVDVNAARDTKVAIDLGLKLRYGVNTHAHADHVTGTSAVRDLLGRESSFKSVISAASGAKADIKVGHGDKIQFGGRHVTVRSTPGHTAGCVSFVLDDKTMVFTGDTLLIRGCGRTDFQEGSSKNLFKSVWRQLFTLPEDCIVYPGHDYKGMTSSTIGEEKSLNPRLGGSKTEAQFAKIMANLKLSTPKRLDEVLPKNMNCGV
eukprot:CAMPEP_0182469546 /NCGR_PEP_ID=MMETSP1319-20130603/17250_1 /TAXON_ID=172717 /ORGANISM="Bolidomonas pacifica, Strain RCC208" /LENGTH=757 /DNA_ID=CAMNT_0024669863 /DNA_START=121 /DNA_END=2394 /DNA_ORIENTATION=-